MKTINFKEISVEVEMDVFKTHDLRKEIGNALFKQASNLTMDELSRKIFKSEKEIQISNEEFSQMLDLLNGVLVYRAVKAIENSAKEIKQKK